VEDSCCLRACHRIFDQRLFGASSRFCFPTCAWSGEAARHVSKDVCAGAKESRREERKDLRSGTSEKASRKLKVINESVETFSGRLPAYGVGLGRTCSAFIAC